MRSMSVGRLLATALLLWAAVGGCSDHEAGTTSGGSDAVAEPRLTGGLPTLDSLGAAAWSAMVAADTTALRRLRLTRHEHDTLVWPEQPAAAMPSASANLDVWWENIQDRDRAARDDLIADWGGSDRRYLGLECPGQPREYATFRALTGCRLMLEGPEGPLVIEAFRYVIEMDGVLKILRYYDE